MDFGQALHALRNGDRVQREGWNGKGMWLQLVPEGEWHARLERDSDHDITADVARLPWIGMKTADNKFVPWLASQTDMLARDWTLVGH